MFAQWWKRLPGRLLEEEQALLALEEGDGAIALSHTWVRDEAGEPRARVNLDLAGGSFELEVRFPPHYPEGCPSVLPVPYDRPVSTHQFKTGVLCLELGPDNWHPDYTAAEMVNSAWRLIARETIRQVTPIDIPSRHVSDLAERVRLADGVLLRSPEFDERANTATRGAGVEFEFVWPLRHFLRAIPVSLPKGADLSDVPPALLRGSRTAAVLVDLTEGAPKSPPLEPKAFREFVSTFGSVDLPEDALRLAVLRWTSGKTRGFFTLSSTVIKLRNVELNVTVGPRTPVSLRDTLNTTKIAIIGLGSVGSKIAVSLARSGARRFVFVDGDVLLGENICRHAATMGDVGAMKVHVARELVRDVAAREPEITCHQVSLASATNPELHARILEDVASADIVVDATADPEAFGLLAMLASDNRRAMVWGEVFAGGIGGMIASADPESGPCPRCVRAGFLASAAAWPPAPSRATDAPYAGGDGEPLVATDADVALVAAAMINRVHDLARHQVQSPAVSLIGFRRGWIFDAALHSVPVHVRTDDRSCPRCWTPASEPDVDATALADALFTPDTHAEDSPST